MSTLSSSSVDNVPSSPVLHHTLSRILTRERPSMRVGKRVLIAFDGTEESHKAVAYAASLFQPGDHVVMATVLPLSTSNWSALSLFATEDLPPNASTGIVKKAALAALLRAAEPLEARGISTSCHVAQGEKKSQLQRLAEFHLCETIVIGKRKRSRVSRLMSSGLSSYFVDQQSLSVVVVN